MNLSHSTGKNWVAKRDLCQLYQQIPQDIPFCLNGKPLIVCVCEVKQFAIEVGPNSFSYLTAELEDCELRFLIVAIL
jgi:hypothetical protein